MTRPQERMPFGRLINVARPKSPLSVRRCSEAGRDGGKRFLPLPLLLVNWQPTVHLHCRMMVMRQTDAPHKRHSCMSLPIVSCRCKGKTEGVPTSIAAESLTSLAANARSRKVLFSSFSASSMSQSTSGQTITSQSPLWPQLRRDLRHFSNEALLQDRK